MESAWHQQVRRYCFRIGLADVFVYLLELVQAGLDLLQVPLSLKVIGQLELKLSSWCSLLLLLLGSKQVRLGWLFRLILLFVFREVAEIRGIPVYFIHYICRVAYELEVEVHQFFLVLLGGLLPMHDFGLLEVLLAHFLCIYVLGLELVVLLLCGNVLLLAFLPLLLPHYCWVLVSHQYVLPLLVLSHQCFQSPLFGLQQLPLFVRLLLLRGLDLAGLARFILNAQVLRPQLLFLRLLPLKLLLYPPYHILLDLPQLLNPLVVATVYLFQFPLYLPSLLARLLLRRCQFGAIVVLGLDLTGELLLEQLNGALSVDYRLHVVLTGGQGMLLVDVVIAGDVRPQSFGYQLLGLLQLAEGKNQGWGRLRMPKHLQNYLQGSDGRGRTISKRYHSLCLNMTELIDTYCSISQEPNAVVPSLFYLLAFLLTVAAFFLVLLEVRGLVSLGWQDSCSRYGLNFSSPLPEAKPSKNYVKHCCQNCLGFWGLRQGCLTELILAFLLSLMVKAGCLPSLLAG